jgi:hypothetical protein
MKVLLAASKERQRESSENVIFRELATSPTVCSCKSWRRDIGPDIGQCSYSCPTCIQTWATIVDYTAVGLSQLEKSFPKSGWIFHNKVTLSTQATTATWHQFVGGRGPTGLEYQENQ